MKKMAKDDVEPMETEMLPSTSNNDMKMKEKDGKSPSLPWYVSSESKLFPMINP